MRLPLARAAWLVFAAGIAACTPAAPVAVSTISAGPVCRVGPDGDPLYAERGIGGTGAPIRQVAERGIGGTGIIGVVTGFASICLAGHEVALPAGVPVEIGGVAADPHALRAGQVAAVEADGPAEALSARRITVRYEVEGPVESIAPNRLQVAGQTVTLSPDTWLRTPPAVGQWVAVSGLRKADGTIAATRLDLVSTHTLVVHGVVQRDGNAYRIGGLPIASEPERMLAPGLPVSVTGAYDEGTLRGASIAPDLLAADPVAYFGGGISHFILEGYTRPEDDRFYLDAVPLLQAPASRRPVGGGRSIVEFRRSGGEIKYDPAPGSDAADRFQRAPTPTSDGARREGPGRGGSAERAFGPAPMPNRAFDRQSDGAGANRFDDGGDRNAAFGRQRGGIPSGLPSGPPNGDGGGGRRR